LRAGAGLFFFFFFGITAQIFQGLPKTNLGFRGAPNSFGFSAKPQRHCGGGRRRPSPIAHKGAWAIFLGGAKKSCSKGALFGSLVGGDGPQKKSAHTSRLKGGFKAFLGGPFFGPTIFRLGGARLKKQRGGRGFPPKPGPQKTSNPYSFGFNKKKKVKGGAPGGRAPEGPLRNRF